MMEWYFGQEAGDLVVPKNQEYLDRLPSPDSWSQWGTDGSENSTWPNNFDASKISSLSDDKSQHQTMFGRGTKDKNQPQQVELSYASSCLGGSSQDSRSDFFFNNLMGTESMDDIFMNSLLQDDVPVPSHSHASFSLSPQYRYSMMSSESDSGNKRMDCQSVPCEGEGVRDMDSFRTPPSSPPDGSDNGHASFSNLSYGNYSDQSNEESQSVKTKEMLVSDQDMSRRLCEEDSSIEESVLMGLETVLCQMSNTTRLCLRDSLYRLAQHSKEHMILGKTKVEDLPLDKFSLLDHDDRDLRSEETEVSVQKTNTIDRAVANLMFNKVDANVQDLLPAMAAKFEHIGKNFEACKYSINKDGFPLSKPCDFLAQSEVPVYSNESYLAMQN
ncbi:hypothetical protein KSS87_008686 [Heliosperma pusillum]|nr:hypothetical protein KSS87_008686 [Heliosperma pusillum]